MPGIKRLLPLALAAALLLSATLPEALAGGLKSTLTESAASESSEASKVALEAAKKATEGASAKKKTSEEDEEADADDKSDKAREAVETEESKADSKLSLSVSAPQGLSVKNGTCRIDPSGSDVLILSWSYDGKCDRYDVSVSGGIYSAQTDSRTLTLPMTLFSPGSYTVAVSAIKGEKTVAEAKLSLTILSKGDPSEQSPEGQSQEGQTPEGQSAEGEQQGGGQPTGSGARSGGSSKSGGKAGEGSEAEQGFSVTPGEALVNTHTSGNREMRLYGALSLTLTDANAMNRLILDDTPLDIRLSDGSAFTATIEDDALALVPQGEPEAWLLNGAALKTLARSGISTLRLTLGSGTVDFPTQAGLTGSNYGALRAEGHTSADYLFSVAAEGCSVTVADRTYRLTEDGELV